MSTKSRCWLALAVGLFAVGWDAVHAAGPAPTVISIPGLHCGGCAKKVVAKLETVAGVSVAEADMKSKTITVVPAVDAIVSPKSLWEAVESADQKPARLEGPAGVFTTKPKA